MTVMDSPTITNVQPSEARVGDNIAITGIGFGPDELFATVTLNGVVCPIVSWSDTRIVCTVPHAPSGNLVVELAGPVNLFSAEESSFEGGTEGGFGGWGGKCTVANSTTYAYDGTHSLKQTNTHDLDAMSQKDITGKYGIGVHTISVKFKGVVGKTYRLDIYAASSGYDTGAAVTATGGWDIVTNTHTFTAGDTWAYLYPTQIATGSVGLVVYWDLWQCEVGALAHFGPAISDGYPFTISTSAILRYVDKNHSTLLDINDGVTYKLMREGFKYPPPTNKQTFADSPLAPGQKPTDTSKPNNRTLTFSIFVSGVDSDALDNALNALFAQALTSETIVEWCPKNRIKTAYFKIYQAPNIDPSSYFRTEYRGTNQAIVTWSCQGYPYANLDKVRLPFVDFKGVNDSFEKRAGDDFENFTETVSGGTITANTSEYLDGNCSLKMTTTNGAHTCKLDDEDFLIVNELHHENYKLFAYKNSGTLTLDFDLLCYDINGSVLGTLALLTAYNPAGTTWMDMLKVAGSPVVYPSDSGLSPRFPAGTVKVKRQIRHDTTIGVVSIDSLVAADTEYIVGHEVEGAMALCIPPGDVLGDAPARGKIYIGSAFCTGPWSPQGSGVTSDINGIHALNDTHGYAVGDGGYIFFYNGLLWATQSSGVSVPLNGVSAKDSTHIWAVGDDGTIRFSNNSSTWAAQTYPVSAPTLTDMGFNIWSDIYTLTNWTKTEYAGHLEYNPTAAPDYWAVFVNRSPDSYIAMNIKSNTHATIDPSCSYRIGVWSKTDQFNVRGSVQPTIDVYFFNAGGGQLGLKQTNISIYATWTAQSVNITPADYPAGTASIGLGLSSVGQAFPGALFTMYFNDFDITLIDNPDLYSVHAISAANIIAVGQYGAIIKGDGSNWTRKTSTMINHFRAVHACDASHIIAVGDYGKIYTSADGETWTLRTSGTTNWLYGVYVLDTTHAWAVGQNGTILFSPDAGLTWMPWTSNTTKTLRSVYAFDATNAWAAGDDGTIMFFSGWTWTSQGSGTSENLNGVSGISATSIWGVGDGGTIIHGISTVGAMPLTNLIVGQRDTYAANWNPIQDAVGTTQTLLYNRHGQYYRAMATSASEKFRFPVGSHRGRHIISLGISFGAATAYDQVTIDCYLEAADGTRLTATTVSLTPLDMGDPNTKFKEVAFATSGTRLADISLPSHEIPRDANEDNIYQVFEVKASGSLATTEWLDCLTLIPVDKCVELSGLSNNFVILDSEGKNALVSQDGGLDTATQYDPTKTIDTPRFEANPAGMNLTVLAGNIVTGDERLTPKLDMYMEYEPLVLLIPEP